MSDNVIPFACPSCGSSKPPVSHRGVALSGTSVYVHGNSTILVCYGCNRSYVVSFEPSNWEKVLNYTHG